MFLTLTIDTHQKKNHKLRLHTKKFDAASGWRKKIHFKKRSLLQKFVAWRKSLKTGVYKMGGQIAMF